MTTSVPLVFGFRPDLRLAVAGDDGARRHFAAEYGPALVEGASDVRLALDFGRTVDRGRGSIHQYKTVRWQVELGSPEPDDLRASVGVAGWPRSFGLSLVQGYFVEPLIAVAASHRGYVLLPAAAIGDGDEAVLLVGRSRSGKSSVCARALAAGRTVLGDDHVLLDARGTCYPFPRRMRFYSDLRQTAPRAYASLPFGTRAGLAGRGVVRRLTRGYVAPPVRVSPDRLRGAPTPGPLPVGRIVVVERDGSGAGDEVGGVALAMTRASEALAEQREKLTALGGDSWRHLLAATSAAESDVLGRAFDRKPVERLVLPAHAGAKSSIALLARRLAIEG